MWSYKSRPGEERSCFIVLKVQFDSKLGNVIHIAVRGLRMNNPRSPDGISESINHMPFSEDAINKSAVKLLKEKVELPRFEDGYRRWREAFEAGHAGIYTISLAEAVKVVETGLNQ